MDNQKSIELMVSEYMVAKIVTDFIPGCVGPEHSTDPPPVERTKQDCLNTVPVNVFRGYSVNRQTRFARVLPTDFLNATFWCESFCCNAVHSTFRKNFDFHSLDFFAHSD